MTAKPFGEVKNLTDFDNNQIELITVLTDTSVVSGVKGLDDNALAYNTLLLRDAAKLIEVY